MKCDICEKSITFGHYISHSNRHTKRQFKPNIHKASIIVNGKRKRVDICTRCLRNWHKVAA